MTKLHSQLSLQVDEHPVLQEYDDPTITGSVKTSIDLMVRRDLQRGQKMLIRVIGEDGELIAETMAKIVGVNLEDVTHQGSVIGTKRVHKAKVIVG